MISFGEVPASSVLPIFFDSFGSNGESLTISGLATTDVLIYKGTSMTQRASAAGITLLDTDGIDLDGITGIQGFSIDLGDNTDAGFYAAGSFYTVVVSSVTINSQTVSFVAATFRIKAAESSAGVAKVDVSHFGGTAGTFSAGIPDVNAARVGGLSAAGDALASYFGQAAVIGTADSGTTTTMVDAALTQADTDYWKGAWIVFRSGNIAGQARLITGFDPATDTVTFAPALTQAVSTQTYIILPIGAVNLLQVLGSTINALQSGRVDSYVGAMANDVVTAAAIATDAITSAELSATANSEVAAAVRTELTTELARIDVAVSTRLATAGYTAPLDAAGTRTAVGLAAANLDTQLAAIDDYIDTEVAAIKAKTDNLPTDPADASDIAAAFAAVPTANQNADALLDRAAGVETGLTIRQAFRLFAAALLGKASGLDTTTAVYRDVGDTKDRISATVDANGNRTAVTLDAS